jgi:Flp pilus assembly protein TadG
MTLRDESGQSLIEVGISLMLLLVFSMAAMDFGYLFSQKLTLQNAVRQAGRYAITGQCVTGSNGSCSVTRYNSVVQTLQNTSLGYLNTSNTGDVSMTCTNEGGGCPNSAGGPGDLVTISVSYPYTFLSPMLAAFFPSHSYTIKVGASFTNESFPPSAS